MRNTNSRLPPRLWSFYDRPALLESTLASIASGHRVLTLVGPPGSGKSAVARELAERWLFADRSGRRAHWMGPDESDRFEPGGALDGALSRDDGALQLVVLDDAEDHITEASAAVARWAANSRVGFVITSRRRLGIAGERLIEVGPLALPPDEGGGDAVLSSDAVRYFSSQAKAANAAFDEEAVDAGTVSRLVRHLDGLPLALRLVGARCNLLSLDQLADRLQRGDAWCRDVAAADVDGHRSVYDAVARSWAPLDDAERGDLIRLSAFAGTFALDDAEIVLREGREGEPRDALAGLQALRDHSLLAVVPTDEGHRFRVYHCVRAFVRLVASGSEELALAQRVHARTMGAKGLSLLRKSTYYEDRSSHASLLLERENLKAAAAWSREAYAPGDKECAELNVANTVAQIPIVLARGEVAEFEREIREALELANEEGVDDETLIARGELARSVVLRRLGRQRESLELLERVEGLSHSRESAEVRGIAAMNRSLMLWSTGETAGAFEAADGAIAAFDQGTDPYLKSRMLDFRGYMCAEHGRMGEAEDHYRDALDVFRETGRRFSEGVTLNHLAWLQAKCGRWSRAEESFRLGRELHDELGRGLMYSDAHAGLAFVHARRSDADGAERHMEEATAAIQRIGDRRSEGVLQRLCADATLWLGKLDSAARRYDDAIRLNRAVQNRAEVAAAQGGRGLVHWARHQFEEARIVLDESLAGARGTDNRRRTVIGLARLMGLDAALGDVLSARGREDEVSSQLAGIDDTMVEHLVSAYRCNRMLTEAQATEGAESAQVWDELVATVTALIDAGGAAGSESPCERSPEVGFAFARLDELHGEDTRAELWDAIRTPNTLVVASGGSWFIPPDQQRVDLGRRKQLAVLVRALAYERRAFPGRPMPFETICEVLWPGEKMLESAATNRVHKTLSMIRKLGLATILSGGAEGYFLSPSIPMTIVAG